MGGAAIYRAVDFCRLSQGKPQTKVDLNLTLSGAFFVKGVIIFRQAPF